MRNNALKSDGMQEAETRQHWRKNEKSSYTFLPLTNPRKYAGSQQYVLQNKRHYSYSNFNEESIWIMKLRRILSRNGILRFIRRILYIKDICLSRNPTQDELINCLGVPQSVVRLDAFYRTTSCSCNFLRNECKDRGNVKSTHRSYTDR